MPASTAAGVISAFAAVFTAVALVITALAGLLAARKATRKIDEVHVMVNQQRTDLIRYQTALIKALRVAGVDVPDDQSRPDE